MGTLCTKQSYLQDLRIPAPIKAVFELRFV